jgi:hypothetical protein
LKAVTRKYIEKVGGISTKIKGLMRKVIEATRANLRLRLKIVIKINSVIEH